MLPHVSIIVLNWNGWEDTLECLESLYQITYPNSEAVSVNALPKRDAKGCYDVILVDNGSEDDSIKKLKEYCEGKIKVESPFFDYSRKNKPIKIVEYTREEAEASGGKENEIAELPSNRKLILIKSEKNYGFAEGNNVGMRYALKALNPDYVLLLNNDTVVDRAFLAELVKVAETDDQIGVVGPVVCYYYQPEKVQSFGADSGFLTEKMLCKGELRETIREKRNVGYIMGCAMLIRSRVLKDIGLIDPIYFLYYEDADFGRRARDNGYRIVAVPTSCVWHKQGATALKVTGIRLYYSMRNRLIFEKRYATKIELFAFFVYVFAYRVPRALVTCLFYYRSLHHLKMFLKGLQQGLLNK